LNNLEQKPPKKVNLEEGALYVFVEHEFGPDTLTNISLRLVALHPLPPPPNLLRIVAKCKIFQNYLNFLIDTL